LRRFGWMGACLDAGLSVRVVEKMPAVNCALAVTGAIRDVLNQMPSLHVAHYYDHCGWRQ